MSNVPTGEGFAYFCWRRLPHPPQPIDYWANPVWVSFNFRHFHLKIWKQLQMTAQRRSDVQKAGGSP